MSLFEQLEDPAPAEPTAERIDAILRRHRQLHRQKVTRRAALAAAVVGIVLGLVLPHLIDQGPRDVVTTAGLPAMSCGPPAPTRIHQPRVETDPTTQAVIREITHAMPVTVQEAVKRPFVTVSAACGAAVLQVQDYRTHNAGPQVAGLTGPPATAIENGTVTSQPEPQPLAHLPSGIVGSITRTSPTSVSITILKHNSPGALVTISYDTTKAAADSNAIPGALVTRMKALALGLATTGPYTDD